jgi:hypothetical protein
MKSISIIFILLAMLFSCDQLTNENTDGNGNDTTQDGGNNQVGDNNSDNENGENNGNSGDNNEDENNTITVDEASKIIANLTSGTHDIKIAGTINIDTFGSICSAISAISENFLFYRLGNLCFCRCVGTKDLTLLQNVAFHLRFSFLKQM